MGGAHVEADEAAAEGIAAEDAGAGTGVAVPAVPSAGAAPTPVLSGS